MTDSDRRRASTTPSRRRARPSGRRGATGPPVIARRHAGLLPARSRPHPDPCQYVMIAVMLVRDHRGSRSRVSYIEGDVPDGLIIVAAARAWRS